MSRGLRALWMRIAGGRRASGDFEAELQTHLEMHTEEGVRSGLSQE